jgi:regulator of protease activity HflC (stomatin/prohibitin superfamily)
MGKQKEWANLRAGAGYAVGSALLGLSLAVANFVGMVGGPTTIAEYLLYIFPVALVFLGAESFLNFVLDIYRPRKPGEYPRPAFESRVLGFVAAPDRIAESIGEALNYQFGYDVSSSWFYRLLSRSAARVLVPVAVVVLVAMSAVVVIRPHEEAMVLRWGQLARTIGPGLHLKWPWPVERVEIPLYTVKDAKGKVEYSARTVSGVRVLDIGTTPPPPDKPILWTNEHAMNETFFLVQPDPVISVGGTREASQAVRGRDLAMVAVEVPLHYAIDDLRAFELMAAPDMRDEVLKSTAQRAVMQYFTGLTAGDLLSGKRDEIREQVRSRIERAFTELNPLHNGRPVVQVLFVGLQGLHPPAANQTALMFEKVVAAQQRYNAQMRDAEATAIKLLTTAAGSVEQAHRIVAELDKLDVLPSVVDNRPNPAYTEQQLRVRALIQGAGGKAADLILAAAADRWKAHMGAKTSLTKYQGQLGMYLANPALFRATRYLEGLKEQIADGRVYITDPRIRLTIRPNLQDADTTVDEIFQSQEQP